MAVTTFAKPRPKCRICGARNHVITGHNPRSPLDLCCASCGVTLRAVTDWLKQHDEVQLRRLADRAMHLLALQQEKPQLDSKAV